MRGAPNSFPKHVGVGRSSASDPAAAAAEATARFDVADIRFALAFVPDRLDAAATATALDESLPGVPFFGCTTAGQITPKGYESNALLVLAFPKENFRCASILFEGSNPGSTETVAERTRRHAEKFRRTAGWNRLALLLCDGLSRQEDLLISVIETALDGLPIFGGSAGDGLKFERTCVLHDGKAHADASVLLLVETDLQFQSLGFDHILPTDVQVVITDSDPGKRIAREINGAPAAQEYARLVGCPVESLSPKVFAENPMLLRHDRNYYVRAVREVAEGHALSFLAAIDDGLVLTLGRGKEIVETMESGLDVRGGNGGAPDFILGFDCVLRKLEIQQKRLGRQVSGILRKKRVFGFNTYGEQRSGVHMNQTFVGVAFFEPEAWTLD